MQKILFLCHGNICRSPMAEFIMKQLLAEAGKADQVEVASAAVTGDGIIGGVGNPMDPRAQRELAKNGVLFSQHRARLLTREDYDKYDYLIAMDSENFMAMNQICGGDPERKQYKLLQFAGSYADIDDPWYTNDFDLAFQEISRGCRGLLDQL
ncbi:MAG: low molecular weight phosphotyrosine protein phosphatase [Lactobacillus delbrueckii]|jgi:protein-tyrosine phosphatase|nr:low molecular weight phosphotyrosine protein phosphatase [Lactobacillus delbrueckii]MCH4218745.1 low molecular weight phosphotyrosine protein phosphatase [Lactobacillus delbrueckii]MCH4252313.1 low molecular weight phosphotyrosine protein phosphatase [Lactobacillus delbrueckii]